MFSIHWHSGKRWYVPINTYYNKKLNTSGKLYSCAIFPHGPLIVYLQNSAKGTTSTTQNQPLGSQHNNNNNGSNNKNISIVVTYTKGLGERIKMTCNMFCITVHFKGNNTIQTLLMALKEKENKCQKCGVIYQFKCPHSNFLEE